MNAGAIERLLAAILPRVLGGMGLVPAVGRGNGGGMVSGHPAAAITQTGDGASKRKRKRKKRRKGKTGKDKEGRREMPPPPPLTLRRGDSKSRRDVVVGGGGDGKGKRKDGERAAQGPAAGGPGAEAWSKVVGRRAKRTAAVAAAGGEEKPPAGPRTWAWAPNAPQERWERGRWGEGPTTKEESAFHGGNFDYMPAGKVRRSAGKGEGENIPRRSRHKGG